MQEMKFIPKDLTDAAKTALRLEDEGYSLYIQAAGRSKNKLAVATFKAIAEKEKMHKKAIEEFYSRITGEKGVGNSTGEYPLLSERLKTEVLKAVKDALEDKTMAEADMLKAYETAMELERKSFEFYKKVADETENEDAKKLFAFLEKEENKHFELLQDTHLYLGNPAEWFHKEEKWLVEG